MCFSPSLQPLTPPKVVTAEYGKEKNCESLDDVINVYIGVNKFQQIMNPSVSVPFSYVYFCFCLPLTFSYGKSCHAWNFIFSMPVSCLFAKFIFLTAFDYNPCAIQREFMFVYILSRNLCEVVLWRGKKKNLRSFSSFFGF